MKKMALIILVPLLSLSSCTEDLVVQNNYGNPKIIEVRNAGDQRNVAAILQYMKSADDTTRQEAAKASISLQDTALIKPLFNLLRDVNEDTRVYAAVALGQNGRHEDILKIMDFYAAQPNAEVRRELLIAIGKLYSTDIAGQDLGAFERTKIPTFLREIDLNDDETKTGFGVMLQHLHRKRAFDFSLMRRCQFALQTSGPEAREALAWALANTDENWLLSKEDYFLNWIKMERNHEVKLPIIIAIAKGGFADEIVASYTSSDNGSYQINIAAIQKLMQNSSTKAEYFLPALKHREDKVVVQALAALESCNISKHSMDIRDAMSGRSAFIRAAWYRLQHHHKLDKDGKSCLSEVAAAEGDYNKSHFIRALGNMPERTDDLIELFYQEKNPIILYAITEALSEIYLSKKWSSKESFITFALKGIEKKDSGVCDLLLSALEASPPGASEFNGIEKALEDYASSLILPKEIEVANHIIRFTNKMTGASKPEIQPSYTYQIPWDEVKYIPYEQTAIFETNKGYFKMKFFVDEAPGSVAFITKLIREKFYDGKYFHRVVSNFVAQGGCPIGNGMGSTDQMIRSEFSVRRFERGSVGLASSGKDTESCQFFITYSPKPHLDGRYTVFAEIVEGMDVIDQLVVGDQIISARLEAIKEN